MRTFRANAIDFLRHLPLFNELNDTELRQLEAMAEHKVIKKNAFAFKSGEASDAVFILVRGIVKIGNEAEDGREVIKHILHPMAIFGELGLAGEQKRQDCAQAMEEVQVFRIPVVEFHKLMQLNYKLAMSVLTMIGGRLKRVEDRLESLMFKDARERIIDFLKDSALKQGKRIGYETLIKHCYTQQDIANITGTSRQTVTSVLNDLKKSNLIYFNRRSILIRDMAKLA
ncbi:MAG: Crp/Fnr family transcriptional regulator [Saprospiraceae bacterium]|nr:Crp/Fnr family transcriptional regulator [Saprospiraceae bacterium]